MAAPSDLVREIEAGGGLTDPAWRAAFEEVPRELFVPYFYAPLRGGGYERFWRDDPDPGRRARWAEGVYADQPLATRVRDGELLSSSSQPSLMARMLEYLDVADDSNVLEIGTGPGYNAGLLCHRLGDSRVTTVDLDPDITEAARRHLAAAGHRPHVVTGDGARGCPARGPYDRVIATCALPRVPPPWLTQCVPGALILAPVASGLVRLRVTDGGRASGHFTGTPAFFVPLRGGTGEQPVQKVRRPGGVPGDALRDDGFRFLLALTEGRLEPVEAYALWRDQGGPGRERYGMSAGPGGQWVWLDDPEGPYVWPMGGTDERGTGTAADPGA